MKPNIAIFNTPVQRTFLWIILMAMASGYAQGQTCPFDTVTFNSSTLPGEVLPAGTTTAQVILVGSGDSSYISTWPDSVTTLIATAPSSSIGDAQIIMSGNFRTNVGDSGTFSASIQECGKVEVSHSGNVASAAATPVQSGRLLVYPTVSSGLFTVTGNSAVLANADVLVVDESGRTVYHLHNGSNTSIDLFLGNLANGLYFIRVNNGSDALLTQRVIINK